MKKPVTRIHAGVVRLSRAWRQIMLALGCALVLSLFGSSVWQASVSLQALGEVQVQAGRVARLDSMLIQLVDAESGARGYLLSRSQAYLEPYLNSLATIEYTLDEIRRDVGTEPQDQEALSQLTGLITLKLGILSAAVGQGTATEEAPRGAETSEGQRYMETIRKTLAGMKTRMAAQGQRSLEQSIAHVQHTRWVVATLSGAALVLLGVLFVALRRQFRLREQLAQLLHSENERLDGLVRSRTAELSDLASYLTSTREAERESLARELHDELGALLTAARMDAAWLLRQLDGVMPDACRERFGRLQQRLDGGIALKRRIIDDLRPPLLRELGLVAALRSLGEQFERDSGLRLSLELPAEDCELPPDPSLALFRIAQEALTNVRRHAGAHGVRLRLGLAPGWLRLEVADDGVGFDAVAAAQGHHGLAGMRHRVQMFAGEFVLDSRPGAGTRIAVGLPLALATPVPNTLSL